ncbi:hypothetical protein PVAND_011669 [Polypedilum vanderplanki]|uniref:C2H2-type domain-containing protein n=1 Tax=Polypedilum vanderplanki TaxID=319348 RepID=A0A9J6CL40_POLVA|nr:hypothetical protein PVAND_011669 [Polypedilum vanderplanki]
MSQHPEDDCQKDFINYLITKCHMSKYEGICKELFNKYDNLNKRRINAILLDLQRKIDWPVIKKSRNMPTEKQSTLQILKISGANDDIKNDFVEVGSSDDEIGNSKQIIIKNQNVSILSSDDDEITKNKLPQKKKRRAVIDSDDSIGKSHQKDRKKSRRNRIIEPTSSSSSSYVTSKTLSSSSVSSNESSSFSSTELEQTNSSSEEIEQISIESDEEEEQSYSEEFPKRRNRSRKTQKRSRKNEAEILKEVTEKSFIGQQTSKMSEKRSKKRINYRQNEQSSSESKDDKISYKHTQYSKKRKIDNMNQILIPSVNASTAQIFDDSSSDESNYKELTVSDFTINLKVLRIDSSKKINGTVRVYRDNDEIWKIREKQLSTENESDLQSNEQINFDESDSDNTKESSIPITKSRSNKSNMSCKSIDIDFEFSENEPSAVKSKVEGEKSQQEVLREKINTNENMNANDKAIKNINQTLPETNSKEQIIDTPPISPQDKNKQDDSLEIIETSNDVIVIDDDDDDIPIDLPLLPNIKKEKVDPKTPVKDSTISMIQETQNTETPERNLCDKAPQNIQKLHVPIKLSPVPKIISNSQKKISNIAFTKCRLGINYKCYAGSCSYNSNNEEQFTYHLQSRHVIEKWSGFCNICGKSFSNIVPLIKEFEHMKDHHIIDEEKSNSKLSEKRSVSKDSIHSEKSNNSSRKDISNKKKSNVCKELNFQTSSNNVSSNTCEKSNISEELHTVEELIEILTGEGDSTENDKNHKISEKSNENGNIQKQPGESSSNNSNSVITQSPIAIISVPENAINTKVLTLPIVSTNENTSSKTIIKTVDINLDLEDDCSDSNKTNHVLRVKKLPGDKLSTHIYQSEPSSSNVQPNAAIQSRSNVQITQQVNRVLPKIVSNHVDKILQPSISQSIEPVSNISNAFNESSSVLKSFDNSNVQDLHLKNKLQPWMKINPNSYKNSKNVETMLNEVCFKELYKCMFKTCDFYTSNNEVFASHLQTHTTCNPLTKLACSYCNFQSSDNKILVNHISQNHGKCKYVCKYCFYRTTCTFNINRHLRKYHSTMKTAEIIELSYVVGLKEEEEFIKANHLRNRFILPITCPQCKQKFYNFEIFEEHRKKLHSNGILFKCNICKNETTESNLFYHLTKCHKINKFHCCYCKFAHESKDAVADHLMDVHSDKLPYYCERINTSQNNTDPSSIETTTIRKFNINRMKEVNKKREPYYRGNNSRNLGRGRSLPGERVQSKIYELYEELYEHVKSCFEKNEELKARYNTLLKGGKNVVNEWIMFSYDLYDFYDDIIKKNEKQNITEIDLDQEKMKFEVNKWDPEKSQSISWENPDTDLNNLNDFLMTIQEWCIYRAVGCLVYHRYVRFNSLTEIAQYKAKIKYNQQDVINLDVGASVNQAFFLINSNLPSIFMIGNEVRVNNFPYLYELDEKRNVAWNDVVVVFEDKNVFIYDGSISKKIKTEYKKIIEEYDNVLYEMKKEWNMCKEFMTYFIRRNRTDWEFMSEVEMEKTIRNLDESAIKDKYRSFFNEKLCFPEDIKTILCYKNGSINVNEAEKKYLEDIKSLEIDTFTFIELESRYKNKVDKCKIIEKKLLVKSMLLFARKHYKYYLIYERKLKEISKNLMFTTYEVPPIKGKLEKMEKEIEKGQFVTTFSKRAENKIFDKNIFHNINNENLKNEKKNENNKKQENVDEEKIIYLREIRGMHRTYKFLDDKTKFQNYDFYFSFGKNEDYNGDRTALDFLTEVVNHYYEFKGRKEIAMLNLVENKNENQKKRLAQLKSERSLLNLKSVVKWYKVKNNNHKKQSENKTDKPNTKKQ